MKTMNKFLLLCSVLGASVVSAQTGTGSYNENVIGDARKIIQLHPQKANDYPRTLDTVIPTPQFKYDITSVRVETPFQVDTIKAAKVTNEPLQKLYRFYVRGGYGNYNTILGEVYANQLRSKNWNAGIHAKHFSVNSSVDDVAAFSGFSENSINAYGKRFLKKHTLAGELGYDRDVLHFYGSDIVNNQFGSEAVVQRFNFINAGTSLKSHYTDSNKINHEIGLRYYFLNDLYKASENNLLLTAEGSRYLNTEKLGLKFGIDYNNNRTEKDTVNNTIVQLQPTFRASGKRFEANIGMGLFLDAGEETSAFFYPQALFSVNVFKNIIIPYAGITGSLSRNSYRSLTQLNPFLLPSSTTAMKNTQNRNVIFAGLKGSISSSVAYNTSISHEQRRNMPLFVYATEKQDAQHNKFVAAYDTVEITTVHGELSYQKSEKIRIALRGDYKMFDPTTQLNAWYNPALNLGFSGTYNIADAKAGLEDKISARVDVFYLGKQFAPVFDSVDVITGSKELKGLVDANIAVQYRYTKYLSFFATFNNLAAQRYYRWSGYPTQKFNFMAGLSYSF